MHKQIAAAAEAARKSGAKVTVKSKVKIGAPGKKMSLGK